MGLFSKNVKPGSAEKQTGKRYREEHLLGDSSYRCSVCNYIFRERKPVCPYCHAKMKKTVTDPVWVDELSMMDGE